MEQQRVETVRAIFGRWATWSCTVLLWALLGCEDKPTDNAYQWHAFYGGTDDDLARGLAVDQAGNLFVAGYSLLPWRGPEGQAPLNAYSSIGGLGDSNIYVLKLDSDGGYLWHTFLGAESLVWTEAIALDSAGNAYVAGSSVAWTGPDGQAPLNAHADGTGSTDIFVLKINPDGEYLWHTFYGSTTFELTSGLAVDSSGNPLICGCAGGAWDGPGAEPPLDGFDGVAEDIFLLKLNGDGVYQWHTFFGSSEDEHGAQLAVDGNDNLYLSGFSHSEWTGTNDQPSLYPHSSGVNSDLVLIKVDPNGTYQWHAFFGTSEGDGAWPVAVDPTGSVYLAGDSLLSWQGPSGEDPLTAHGEIAGKQDMVIIKLDGDGTYRWHTFFSNASASAMVVDQGKNLTVVGTADQAWDGPGGESPLNPHYQGVDLFAMQLDPQGTYIWHSFYGGDDGDYEWGGDTGGSLAIDSGDNLYLAGYSANSWSGPDGQPPITAHAAGTDILVMKLSSRP